MLDYDLESRGELCLYEFLYRRIRDDIVSGAIGPDDRLPSKRPFARHLGVSLITVESAYAQLLAEGYVHSLPRRGYYASRLPGRPREGSATVACAAGFAATRAAVAERPEMDACAEIAERAEMAGCVEIAERAAAPANPTNCQLVADFAHPSKTADPEVARLWGRTLRAVLGSEDESEVFAQPPARGAGRLRAAIAGHLRAWRGMDVDPGCIVVGAGAQYLYGLIVQLVGRERIIAVEDPGYPLLTRAYEANGVQVSYVPLDGAGVRMDALRASGASVAHLMPSHQFPTGRVTSVARRYELLGWAAQASERLIVEDDYDCEFRLSGRPVPSLASIDAAGSVIYTNTFSRSLGSALRLAYMVLPPALMRSFDERLGFYASSVSMVDQVALAHLLESGDYERHVNRYRTRQRTARDALVAALGASPLAGRLSVEEADSGLHFVLGIETGASEAQLASAAARRGVGLAPLSGYACRPENRTRGDCVARFVMRYDGVAPEAMPQAAELLAQAVVSAERRPQ